MGSAAGPRERGRRREAAIDVRQCLECWQCLIRLYGSRHILSSPYINLKGLFDSTSFQSLIWKSVTWHHQGCRDELPPWL